MEMLKEIVEIGKAMGLEGDKLTEFIDKRQNVLREEEREKGKREERSLERDLKRDEMVRADKRLELEFHMLKEQREQKERVVEKEIELESIRKDTAETSFSHKNLSDCTAKMPKLPPFNEDRDSMDAYLKRFERFAENAGWQEDRWASNLSALLQGKALDVYSRLSASESLDYTVLRDALLKRYQLTEEGFRQKLRDGKLEPGETASQFAVRLESYLTRWMGLAGAEATYDGLKDIMLREQFIQSSGKNLALFLKERKPRSVTEMAQLADQYNEAHMAEFRTQKQLPHQSGKNHVPQSDRSKFPYDSKVPGVRRCYICSKADHEAKDCPRRCNKNPSQRAAGLDDTNNYNSQGDFGQGYRGRGRGYDRGRGRGYNRGRGRGYDRGRGRGYGRGRDEDRAMAMSEDETQVKTVANCMVETNFPKCCILGDQIQSKCGHTFPFIGAICNDDSPLTIGSERDMPVLQGYMGNQLVSVLRDSGCSSAVVRRSLVHDNQLTGRYRICVLIDGTARKVEVSKITVNTPFFVGEVEALCMENPLYDLILGNIPGVRGPNDPNLDWIDSTGNCTANDDSEDTCAVQTRKQKASEGKTKVLKVPKEIAEIGVSDLRDGQNGDDSLHKWKDLAEKSEKIVSKNGNVEWAEIRAGVLYRKFQSEKVDNGKLFCQVLVPKVMRTQVMKLAHDTILAGHLGVRKMTDKILSEFYWPGVKSDIVRYCRSCDLCQKTYPRGKVSKLPIGTMPLIETPFSRVAVDLIGPIHPPTDKGQRFILTLVDYATRYPEATPLKNIDTETVAEALVQMFSRVGVPNEILSDLGTQFTSDLMREVSRLLSLKQLTTTCYNPKCNGLCERFNGTLKGMLKKMCSEEPKQWDRYIAPLLFAYREATQESLGFSPFELLYGRTVRGPMVILKELWTKEMDVPEIKTTYQYVVDLRNRLEQTCELARTELAKNQVRYKKYADQRCRDRKFQVGDKVLLLLPTDKNKLLMQWQGPYNVVSKLNAFDYKVEVRGKVKLYHANLLKLYIQRDQSRQTDGASGVMDKVGSALIEPDGCEDNDDDYLCTKVLKAGLPSLYQKETYKDVDVNKDLSHEQRDEVNKLLEEYSDVLNDIPGSTELVEHEVRLTSDEPVRLKPYPVPHALKEGIKQEIESMLKLGIIEPSESNYSSPIVIVKKPDGSNRFCIDFRKLNRITEFDAEPIGNPDDIFARLTNAKFLTKIDLSKGYFQISVNKECRKYTAFSCSEKGLYQFLRLPFGMINSGASFCRMMRKLLSGMKDIDNFVDDIIIFSESWRSHILVLKELFSRLRKANLTARPSKCMVGHFRLEFLGHVVGEGKIQPKPSKVECIQNSPTPKTKTQVRSFLGLVGYFRRFVPNFSTIAAPLTDLTKKGEPNKVRWGDPQEKSFRTLVNILTSPVVLRLPKFEDMFILRTDASNYGLGAVLLQEVDGVKFPIAYASKKLLDREVRYSTIEKECLGLVWGISKFHVFLYGREFILETDHQPLVYINRAKVANARIMRWALALQQYRFRIIAIKGSENVGADYLSRQENI